MNLFVTIGTRPNFIKVAPLLKEFNKSNIIKYKLIHSGQHYDDLMSDVFFKDLDIPKPDINLGIGSGSHAEQTGYVMIEFEKILLKDRPDLVIVIGDVNSTLAYALAAQKLHIPIAHIEAGLRSKDMKMPEEVNRILTDMISDYLFVTEEAGVENLLNNGIDKSKIFLVGNIMIDSIVNNMEKIDNNNILERLNIKRKEYCYVTLHRPSNVDNPDRLKELLNVLVEISEFVKVVFPIHPRTLKNITTFGFMNIIELENILCLNPVGYIDSMTLMKNSLSVITDSGGIQGETTFFKVPCFTMRKNSGHPCTYKHGSNVLIPPKITKFLPEYIKGRQSGLYDKTSIVPDTWDGKTSERIRKILEKK